MFLHSTGFTFICHSFVVLKEIFFDSRQLVLSLKILAKAFLIGCCVCLKIIKFRIDCRGGLQINLHTHRSSRWTLMRSSNTIYWGCWNTWVEQLLLITLNNAMAIYKVNLLHFCDPCVVGNYSGKIWWILSQNEYVNLLFFLLPANCMKKIILQTLVKFSPKFWTNLKQNGKLRINVLPFPSIQFLC